MKNFKRFTLGMAVFIFFGISLRAQDYVPFPFSDAE